ncbi:hypothetical protein JCM19046_3052 [Bacillus sp. JCM 19046]|nr:hypothetical protein JCM19045_342 [Bacillus sp. JCM 19045]GAF18476.1 hypothetical protein JCM19046_3052 [Bacillus sp. JCM 19046]
MAETVFNIPGQWPTKIISLNALLGEYGIVVHQDHFLDLKTNRTYEYERGEKVAHLSDTFYPQNALTAKEKWDIDAHESCLYIIAETDSLTDVEACVTFINRLLKIDGVAVKVESSGGSYSRNQWLEMQNADNLYTLMTVLIEEQEGTYYTCGFQQFGEQELLFVDVDKEIVSEWIEVWINMSKDEKQTCLNDGFIQKNNEKLNASVGPCTIYPEDDLFFNSHGFVVLTVKV